MPNANYQRGVRFEREIMDYHKRLGYQVIRASGSHGLFDVIAFDFPNEHIKFIQCKVKKDKKMAGRFRKTELAFYRTRVETYKHTKYIK